MMITRSFVAIDFFAVRIRRAVRARVLYPIAGLLVDRAVRWLRGQDGWEQVVSAAAHALLEDAAAIVVRARLAEVIRDFGPYLSRDSIDLLRLIEDIARKHSPEAN